VDEERDCCSIELTTDDEFFPVFVCWLVKAYRQGVVITVCKGCMNKHLIADNLGWMQYVGGFDGNSNIEDYMNDIGRGDEVNRVSQEVFELEKLVHSDADDNLSSSSLDETENNSFE